ncbi:hypothetical protein HY522_08155, partial [bacterium]|nr:hypothetical protein [bacterium]
KGCFAALLQQEDLSVVQRLLLLKYGVKITARMGVNTGIVAAGNMGSEKKRQYTVMGEAVTIAEELEPINKLYESWIAIGALTYEKSADYVDVRLLDRAAMGVAGHPHEVYELLGWKRDKFLDHWNNRPVPPLFIEAWRKLTPEKILGYLHYWDGRKFKDSPFYRDLRTLFDGLAPVAIETIHANDIAARHGFRTEQAELDATLRGYDNLIAGSTLPAGLLNELEQFKEKHAKAAEDWLKILWGWKVQLKEQQGTVLNLQGKIPTADWDELVRFVDTHQKRVECYLKRCSFPAPTDTVGSGLAEHLKGLIVDGKDGMSQADASAKSQERMGVIRGRIDAFLDKLPGRAQEYHEFMADHCETPAYKFKVRDAFDEARKIYLQQNWDAAEKAFKAVLEIDPNDGPATKYIERVAHLRKHPPPKDWDGVWAEE